MNPTRMTTTVAAAGMLLAVTLTACSSSSSTAPAATTPSGSGSSSSSSSGTSTCTAAHPNVQTLAKGKLQVSAYVSPPYTAQNGSSIDGVDGTIIKKIAQMECLTLDINSVSGAAQIAGIQAKRVDLGVGGIYYTAARAKILSLSIPMYQDGMALLSKSKVAGTISDLKGKTVGVIQGYLWNADLQKALGVANVKVYQSSDGMIADLKNGRLAVAVLTSAEAGYRAKQTSGLLVTPMQSTPEVAASQSKGKVILAIAKDETALTAALNADIKTLLSDGTIKSALTANGMDPSLAGGTL